MSKIVGVLFACALAACSAAPISQPSVTVDVSPEAGPQSGGTSAKSWCDGSCADACYYAWGPGGQYCTAYTGCGQQCNCCAAIGDECQFIRGAAYCCAPNQTACYNSGPGGGPVACGTVWDGCGGMIGCPNYCPEGDECINNQCHRPSCFVGGRLYQPCPYG